MNSHQAYIVTYDLNQQGQNYDCIREKLKSFGTYWNIQGSVWIIKTDVDAVEIATALQKCLDDNDTLFVSQLSLDSAWVGFDKNGNDWLAKVLNSEVGSI